MNATEITERLGKFNDFPPGWREITPEEFAITCVKNRISHTQFRSMRDHTKGFTTELLDGQLFIFPDLTGVAVTSEYQYQGPHFTDYVYATKFWAFGCNHQFKEVAWDQKYGTQFQGLHLWQCKQCGEQQVVDSSD